MRQVWMVMGMSYGEGGSKHWPVCGYSSWQEAINHVLGLNEEVRTVCKERYTEEGEIKPEYEGRKYRLSPGDTVPEYQEHTPEYGFRLLDVWDSLKEFLASTRGGK